MVDATKTGLAAAVDLAMQDAEPPEGAVTDQLPLFPAAGLVEGEAGDPLPPRPRGRGRPSGSRNRSTEEWREFILSRYQSPLIALAETYSRDVADLARELKCTRYQAHLIQLQAAKELAPYMHSKMPQALEIDSKSDITLVIEQGAAFQGALPGDGAVVIDVEVSDQESEENQYVSNPVGQGKSDDAS